MSRVAYRLCQGWRYLFPARSLIDDDLVKSILSGRALALFLSMSLADQAHACCVLKTLQVAGPVSSDLAQAALLHDVAKAEAGLTLFYRACIIVMRQVCPKRLAALSAKSGPGWGRPFYLQAHHAENGARMARDAGCSERTAWLIAHHDLRPANGKGMITDKDLIALQAADDRC